MTTGDEQLARVTSLSAWSSGRSVTGESAENNTARSKTVPGTGTGTGSTQSEVPAMPSSGTPASTDSGFADSGIADSGRRERSPMHPAGSALRRQIGADPADSTAPDSTASGTSARSRRPENVSMHALTRRGMSRWELEKLLETREVEPEEIEAELARLESVGLVDDQALADTVVRTQHERKGLSRSALKAELRRRHIDDEQIGAALDGIDDDTELARARELAQRRAPQMANLDPVTAARRLSGYIARKGYSSSVVRTVVDEALTRPRSGVRFDD